MSEKNLNNEEGSHPTPAQEEEKGALEEAVTEEGSFASNGLDVPLEQGAVTQPSKAAMFLRRLLVWAAVCIVLFALGILAAWMVRGREQAAEIGRLQSRLETIESEIKALEDELQGKSAEVESLQTENAILEEQLTQRNLQNEVLRIFVDLTSAQLALASDDPLTAKASLVRTDGRLEKLQMALQGEEQKIVEGMRTRLALVLSEIDGDAFAPKRDLEVLTNSLVGLQRSLFGD